MVKWWKPVGALAISMWSSTLIAQAIAVDFEDLSLDVESYWTGYDTTPYDPDDSPPNNEGEEHPFVSRAVSFYNYHHDGWNPDWGGFYFTYWEGWAYSNKTDTTTKDYTNAYSAITGGGFGGSPNYAVGYMPETDHPETDVFRQVSADVAWERTPGQYGFYATNTTYAYYSMLEGDYFARKFGGDDGTLPDYFKLIITGLDGSNDPLFGVDPVEFYLADYTSENSLDDYILDSWTWVDLTDLVDAGAENVRFVFDGSVANAEGMVTPLYFAMDAPEPGTVALLGCGSLVLLLWRRRRRHSTPGTAVPGRFEVCRVHNLFGSRR